VTDPPPQPASGTTRGRISLAASHVNLEPELDVATGLTARDAPLQEEQGLSKHGSST
jgi:hypothetical protein